MDAVRAHCIAYLNHKAVLHYLQSLGVEYRQYRALCIMYACSGCSEFHIKEVIAFNYSTMISKNIIQKLVGNGFIYRLGWGSDRYVLAKTGIDLVTETASWVELRSKVIQLPGHMERVRAVREWRNRHPNMKNK